MRAKAGGKMIDESIHRIHRFLKFFQHTQKVSGTEIKYYYCEERLYLFCFPDGKIGMAEGINPENALDNFINRNKNENND